jgi:hypothetical protein
VREEVNPLRAMIFDLWTVEKQARTFKLTLKHLIDGLMILIAS